MVKLKCVEIIRGKDNSISEAVLSNGEVEYKASKEEIKNYLYNKEWKIDILKLTSDGRLIEINKDTLIEDYEKSCSDLGVKPLKIEKRDNDYVVIDFPNNPKHIIIPDFATGVIMSKRFRRSDDENSSIGNNTNNNILIKSEYNKKLDDVHSALKVFAPAQLKSTKKIQEDIRDIKSKLLELEKEPEVQMDEINDLLEELLSDRDESLLGELNEIKDMLKDSGTQVLNLKQQLEPMFNDFLDCYFENKNLNNYIEKETSMNSVISNIPRQVGYVLPENYLCLDENKYNNYFKELTESDNDYFIKPLSFDILEGLYSYYIYYEKIYDEIELVLKTRSEDELSSIVEFREMVAPYVRILELGSLPFNLFSGVRKDLEEELSYKKSSSSKLNGFLAKLLDKSEKVVEDRYKLRLKKRLQEELQAIYSCPHFIDTFNELTDEEIAIYLAEYYALSLVKEEKRERELYFDSLFKYFKYMHDSEIETTLSEDEKKKIALSYIISSKIISDLNNFNLNICLIPYYKDIVYSNNTNEKYNEHLLSYINLRNSLFYRIFYSYLILLGFKPKYAKFKIYDYILDNSGLDLLDLRDEDLESLVFNLKDYEGVTE